MRSSEVKATGPRQPARSGLSPASMWLGVGVTGVLVFALGIFRPAWSGVIGAPWIEVTLAVVGGILATVGWTRYGRSRTHPSRATDRPVLSMPGVEVFRPGDQERRGRLGGDETSTPEEGFP